MLAIRDACVAPLWRWRVPLAVAMFQVAPVTVDVGDDGHLKVALGYGAGSYLQRSFSCRGAFLAERKVQWNGGPVHRGRSADCIRGQCRRQSW
jgi:hypothetical protein